MISKGLVLLLWVFFIHLAGIYFFIRGFLLTALPLSGFNACSSDGCSLTPTYNRTVLLVIDALRFDFISPVPPSPPSPYHHNVLTLPRELTAARPQNSFIFNAYADPPTTTLQRVKALSTGSLPTFVDLGIDFGGSSIAQDSLLKQLRTFGKKVAFLGDDTWMTVFPYAFQPNITFPYESFNVEDIHTVDQGVIANLFPLLEDNSKPFDFLIAHFLGVDHAGHRSGTDHPTMKAKLEEMNRVITRVVDLLDDDTLLILLGDHGMNGLGDHASSGELETSSALWIYSKGPPISYQPTSIPSSLLPSTLFPGATTPYRSIQQIDLLPTLSLLLGLPIPFNNLGTIIPELFSRNTAGGDLERALEINAAQIMEFLNAYRSIILSGELEVEWPGLQAAWLATQVTNTTETDRSVALYNFNRLALETCRSLWAQFNLVLMGLGLMLMTIGVAATWSVYSGLSRAKNGWDSWLSTQLQTCLRGSAAGAVLGFIVSISLQTHPTGIDIDALDCILFAAPLISALFVIVSFLPSIGITTIKTIPLLLVLHALSFFSSSSIIWEDRIVPLLILSSTVPTVLKGFMAPTPRLRSRILGFSLLFCVCVRLMAMSTVCREEQHSYCYVTFYASPSLFAPPLSVLFLVWPASLGLPIAVKRFLGMSRSDVGISQTLLPWILRPVLFAGSGYWVMEWVDSAKLFGEEWCPILRAGRTGLAWLTFCYVLVVGLTLWWIAPLCLDISVDGERPGGKKEAKVIGYANAFGSSYLLFWMISLSVVYATTQLAGQLVLGLSTIALLAHLEVVDSVRDVQSFEAAFASSTPSAILDLDSGVHGPGKQSPAINFADIVPVALLGLHAFFGTGHQSALSSIQWKSGFMLSQAVIQPFSPMTAATNSFGALFLVGLAAPLLALWNRAPLAQPSSLVNDSSSANTQQAKLEPDTQVRGESTLAALGIMMFFATLLLGTAVSATILRRHSMVWKVFAPRFMAAVVGLVFVDTGVLIGVGFGVQRVGFRVSRIFAATTK